MRWHTPKSKSEVSCGFAGSQVFCFSSQKWRKVLKTLGFSGVPRSGTLFEKNFWFSVVLCGCFVYQLVWENVLSLYLDKGVSFWGCFGKKLCKRAIFFQQSHAIHSCEDSIAVLHGCSQKRSLTLLPQHEGRKNDTFFQIFSKNLRCPLSLRPACRIVAYTGNGRRTHNRKAARLIPDRDKQAADD